MQHLVNPFELPGNWYKADLHAHTTVSDGQLSPADRVEQYRRAGYDVLALTDHVATNDVQSLTDERMLVVGGMEYHPVCPTHPFDHLAKRFYRPGERNIFNLYHLIALNIPHGFKFDDPDDANRCIAQVRAAGGETFAAHMSWGGFGYEDFRDMEDLAAIEIYNAGCDINGRPSSENEWSIALDHGWALPAVGGDDAHRVDTEEVFGCWTWLKMPEPTAENVVQAVRTGACYVSNGPEIHDFRIADGKIQVRCSPVAKICFTGGPGGLGRRRRADEGETITSFAIDLNDETRLWPYIRATVTDSAGRQAWANPIIQ
ncbi:MAG: CehA/McbA family metallohydrolase [Phycisphaerae bacterium]|nr:CehA/McbA family metallohydrolase [Phycisphaerae bacterium]